MPIRVLIVDDSAIVRQILTREISRDPDIEVIASATDAYDARDKIVQLRPDVITLDVEMPKMDGITFLKKLMKAFPLPIIIVSGVTPKGCTVAMDALESGAIDVIEKPSFSEGQALAEFSSRLCDTIKSARQARIRTPRVTAVTGTYDKKRSLSFRGVTSASRIIAIGSSTGGTEALRDILTVMPPDCPPILIVQHMPEKFTKAFADRLNSLCHIEVMEAANNLEVKPGRAIIGRGNHHLVLQRGTRNLEVEIRDGPLVCRHKPSVEVLFNSVAKVMGKNAVGAILTGMGADGAQGLKNMRDAGANTLAQDEASCVVFGMPKEAIKLGAAEQVIPLDKMASTLLSYF